MPIIEVQFGGELLSPIFPSTEDHGWKKTIERIELQWMTCRPAPDEVLDLLSCDCKHGCQPEKCSCLTNTEMHGFVWMRRLRECGH